MSSKEQQRDKPPGIIQQAQAAYDQVVRAVIRPPRTEYEPHHLGPRAFEFMGKVFRREDFTAVNELGQRLKCSRWAAEVRPSKMIPAVIFMHGNASARIEALSQLSVCLSLGVGVVAFDFSGSGLSDGEYVTLGARERLDVRAVVQYLRDEGKTSTIALWGRSMGAVTALLYGDEDNMLDAIVLDSPFASLRLLAEDLVQKASARIPAFAVHGVLRFVRASIQKRAGFDIDDVSAISHVQRMYIPALFCVARDDNFIANSHSDKLHAKYAGEKFYLAVDGDHNEVRPPAMHLFVRRFLQRFMQIPPAWVLPDAPESIFTSKMPWHPSHGRPNLSRMPLRLDELNDDTQDHTLAVGMDQAKVGDVHNKVAALLGHHPSDSSKKHHNANHNNNNNNRRQNGDLDEEDIADV